MTRWTEHRQDGSIWLATDSRIIRTMPDEYLAFAQDDYLGAFDTLDDAKHACEKHDVRSIPSLTEATITIALIVAIWILWRLL